jgi:hypothetical protein
MILIFIFARLGNAIIGETTIKLNQGDYNSFLWFGFDKGGEIQITIVFNSTYDIIASFYLCTPSQYAVLSSRFDESYCLDDTKKINCEFAQNILSNSGSSKWVYEETTVSYITYNFVLTSCNPDLTIQASYVLKNPGGEQLSSGVLEIKYLMIGFFVGWDLLILVWLFKWVIVKNKKPTIIQIALMINCLLWCIFSITFYIFLKKYSNQGIPNDNILTASIWLIIVSECCFFSVLQMISSGISVRVSSIEKKSIYKVTFNVVLLMFCYFLYVVIGTKSFFFLSGAYGVLLILYICDIKKVFKGIHAEMENMIDLGEEIIDSKAWNQARMYRIIIISLIMFLVGLMATSSVYIYYYYMPWIGVGAHIYLIYNCSLILSFYFRFQNDSPYSITNVQSSRT